MSVTLTLSCLSMQQRRRFRHLSLVLKTCFRCASLSGGWESVLTVLVVTLLMQQGRHNEDRLESRSAVLLIAASFR